MEYFFICLAAFLTAGLTLFSGFGLSTILMPVFALVFPLDVAIALAAIVHLLNNLLKLALLGKNADIPIAFKFGLPAMVTAFFGAQCLIWFSSMSPFFGYLVFGHRFSVMPVKLTVAVLMVLFALSEVIPRLQKITIERKYLSLGGVLSGFFGGLSGHQGALRSVFLVRCNLTKESFIATGVLIACLVDISRLSVYGFHFLLTELQHNAIFIAVIFSAFFGTLVASRLVQKVTLQSIQLVVSALLFIIALALGAGLI